MGDSTHRGVPLRYAIDRAALSARRDLKFAVANNFAVTPLVPDSFPELNSGARRPSSPAATRASARALNSAESQYFSNRCKGG